MPKNKTRFKCQCGHDEDKHNWDPWSIYFGICETRLSAHVTYGDGSPSEPVDIDCPCNDYKADNLKYLEELSEKKSAR
jgi:hypothetical protein